MTPAPRLMRSKRVLRLCALVSAALLALAPLSASALDPERSLAQYKHSRWTRAEGAPATINRIAQTPDGHLWLASLDGLFRFDGINFEKIDTEVRQEADGTPGQLLVARNGDVWIWYEGSGRFAVYRNGALQFLRAPPVGGTVVQLAEGPDGAIWAGVGQIGRPMLRYFRGRWEQLDPSPAFGRDGFMNMVMTADGAVWLSYVNQVLRLAPGSNRAERVLDARNSYTRLALDRDGRVWMSSAKGSRPLSGARGRWPVEAATFYYPTDQSRRRGQMLFDRNGNIWVARRTDGIELLRKPSASGPSPGVPVQLDELRSSDGLTSDVTRAVFEDREGNIWVGTSLGLDRFRNANVVVEPLLTRPAAFGDILFSASDGSVYVAQSDTVYRIAPGESPQPVVTNTTEPEAICEGLDHTIWIAFADRILALGATARRSIERPRAETGIYECGFDRWNRFWLTAAGSGMYLRAGSQWQHIAPEPPGDAFYPTMMVADRDRVLWVWWGEGRLVRLEKDQRRLARFDQRGSVHEGRNLYATPTGLLLVGDAEIGRLRDGRFAFATSAQLPRLVRASGLVQTPQGETWAMGPPGIVRVLTRDLERAFDDASFVPPARVFDFQDGLPERYANQSWRSLVRGGDGRIWAATLSGTVWIDPARLHANPTPPPIAITSLAADDERYRDPRSLRLPAGASNVTIGYAVLSLAIPERIRVRYRLIGYDKGWINPGMRRQAFYTNLPAGTYRFHVIAANESGVWNQTGAQLEFTIPPTFLQSAWFVLLCLLAVAGLLWIFYRIHIHRLAQRFQQRMEERLSERERIARELHDTLLQSVQGLVLKLQSVVSGMAGGDPARAGLESALERADDVIAEGRNRVKDLRLADRPASLRDSIRLLMGDAGFDAPVAKSIVVKGTPRPIHPMLAAEMASIVGEALMNAARHAKASRVEVEIRYEAQQLGVRVNDNGIGIAKQVLTTGFREGHYGLVGMRERADRIGATFLIESDEGAGTRISFTVPGKLAFIRRQRGHWWRPVLKPKEVW